MPPRETETGVVLEWLGGDTVVLSTQVSRANTPFSESTHSSRRCAVCLERDSLENSLAPATFVFAVIEGAKAIDRHAICLTFLARLGMMVSTRTKKMSLKEALTMRQSLRPALAPLLCQVLKFHGVPTGGCAAGAAETWAWTATNIGLAGTIVPFPWRSS
jgi:hypothetical protein